MRAAVDVMGGDKAPAAILKGCWEAAPLLDDKDLVYLVGDRKIIEEGLAAMNDRFDVSVVSRDFWNDPAAQSAVDAHAFAGAITPFESRFVRKRKPIYFVRLDRR